MPALRILHTNDLHGALPGPGMEALRELRARADLYLDSGDVIRTGNLGVPMAPEPAWSALRELRCDAGTLGNRETHPVGAAFRKKIEGAAHPLLVANATDPNGVTALPERLILESCGLRIGLLGVMVPMATERMKTKALWSMRWTDPIAAALDVARELRPQVEAVFALTHIGLRRDRELAARAEGLIDVVFGGHSHDALPEPERVGSTFIVQGGSHGRWAGLYAWENGVLTGSLHPLREATR